MARVAIEDFSDREITRIYIAQNIKEATQVEQMLSKQNIDYAIELESYFQITLFSSEYVGAVFYVLADQADFCREVLESAGLSAGIV